MEAEVSRRGPAQHIDQSIAVEIVERARRDTAPLILPPQHGRLGSRYFLVSSRGDLEIRGFSRIMASQRCPCPSLRKLSVLNFVVKEKVTNKLVKIGRFILNYLGRPNVIARALNSGTRR